MPHRSSILGFEILPVPHAQKHHSGHAGKHHAKHGEKFIQRAIKHKGSLHRFAAKHHALNMNGTINLTKTKHAALKLKGAPRTHRLRQLNLATRLRSFHHGP